MSSEQFLAAAAAAIGTLLLGAEHLGGVGLRTMPTTTKTAAVTATVDTISCLSGRGLRRKITRPPRESGSLNRASMRASRRSERHRASSILFKARRSAGARLIAGHIRGQFGRRSGSAGGR
jgi:hypothetical protein